MEGVSKKGQKVQKECPKRVKRVQTKCVKKVEGESKGGGTRLEESWREGKRIFNNITICIRFQKGCRRRVAGEWKKCMKRTKGDLKESES